jgi:hypothetical protein
MKNGDSGILMGQDLPERGKRVAGEAAIGKRRETGQKVPYIWHMKKVYGSLQVRPLSLPRIRTDREGQGGKLLLSIAPPRANGRKRANTKARETAAREVTLPQVRGKWEVARDPRTRKDESLSCAVHVKKPGSLASTTFTNANSPKKNTWRGRRRGYGKKRRRRRRLAQKATKSPNNQPALKQPPKASPKRGRVEERGKARAINRVVRVVGEQALQTT